MKKINLFLIAIVIIIITACAALSAKEVGRIPISNVSDTENPEWKSTSVQLTKGDKLWFWTEMDIEYQGNVEMEYAIQLIKNKDTVGYVKLNPFEKKVTLNEIKTTLMNETKWRFSGQMDFLKIEETTNYTFRQSWFQVLTNH